MNSSERLKKTIPSKRVCEEFKLTYELKGAQKAIDLLARYYEIRRMKIVVDGRRVGNGDEACYSFKGYKSYFKKRTICRSLVLHEFYHHIAYVKDWDIRERTEEKEANIYAMMLAKR